MHAETVIHARIHNKYNIPEKQQPYNLHAYLVISANLDSEQLKKTDAVRLSIKEDVVPVRLA